MKFRIVTTLSVTLLVLASAQTAWAQASNQPKPSRAANEHEQTARLGMYFAVMCDFSSADGQPALARSFAEKAISLLQNPGDDFEFYAKGVAYEVLANYDLALINFDQAIQYNPQKVVAYIHRGRVYSRKRNFERGLADFDKAIQLDAEKSESKPSLNKRDLDPTSNEVQELIQRDPRPWLDYLRSGAAYLERGKTYLQKEDTDRAIADFTKVIQLDPEGANAYNSRGAAYGNKGDFDRAIADFDKALELNPHLKNAHQNRGLAYSRKGDEARASIDFEKEKELYPHDPSAPVNGGVLNGRALRLGWPKYPLEARNAHAGGSVLVQVLIDEKGTVVSARAVSGDRLLRDAAVEAAKNSLFTPTVLAGMPVKVTGVIQYNFVAQ